MRKAEGESKDETFRIVKVPRAREVGQSYATSVLTTLWAFFSSVSVVLKYRPQAIICNGPGICVPVVFAALLLRFLGFDCRVMFVESACRVERLSLSGKILYHLSLCDLFLVQWEALIKNAAPKAICVGRSL